MAHDKLAAQMPVVPTPGGQGHQFADLLAYIRWLIQREPPKDPTAPITLKFCFDGCTMTSGKRIQQEVGAVDLLYPEFSTAQCKSINTTHQFVLYR